MCFDDETDDDPTCSFSRTVLLACPTNSIVPIHLSIDRSSVDFDRSIDRTKWLVFFFPVLCVCCEKVHTENRKNEEKRGIPYPIHTESPFIGSHWTNSLVSIVRFLLNVCLYVIPSLNFWRSFVCHSVCSFEFMDANTTFKPSGFIAIPNMWSAHCSWTNRSTGRQIGSTPTLTRTCQVLLLLVCSSVPAN